MWRNDPAELALTRAEAAAALGAEALVHAIAVCAFFHMMTRLADGTGTPLDHGSVAATEAIRHAIGVNNYVSRRHLAPRQG